MSNVSTLPGGIHTAVLTPLNYNLEVDHTRLVQHMQWLLQRGNDGLTLMGTTGEANSFSVDERMRVLEAVLEGGIPPGTLLVGTGCCAVPDTVTLTRHALSHRVAGILLLPPFYYKHIRDTGLENYIEKVLDDVGSNDLQVFLYHFPQLTGVPFSTALTERLVNRFPANIVGMKDSGGDWKHMAEVLKALPGFRLFAGSEKFLLAALRAGGAGCISATANLTSPAVAKIYQGWKNGGGEIEQSRATLLREALEMYPAIGTLKYLFAKQSGIHSWLNIRPPNVIISADEGSNVEARLKSLDFVREP